MATEEKKELNMEETQKKEKEALRLKFIKIFEETSENSYKIKMPSKLAWSRFEKMIDSGFEIDKANPESSIGEACKNIRIRYFSKELGFIVDHNGNPDLEETLVIKPNFLENNPKIKNAIAKEPKGMNIKAMLAEYTKEEFWEKFNDLGKKEKIDVIDEILNNISNKSAIERRDLEQIRKDIKNDKKLTEEQKNKIYRFETKNDFEKVFQKIKLGQDLNEEEKKVHGYDLDSNDKLVICDLVTQLMNSQDDNDMKLLRSILPHVMNEEEIDYYKNGQIALFNRALLNHINALTDGAYKNLQEFIKKRKELHLENFKKNNKTFDEVDKLDDNFEFNIEALRKKQDIIQSSIGKIKSQLNSKMEKKIFKYIRTIDFSQDENILMFVNLYLDCKKEDRFFNKEFQTEKLNAIRNVLEKVIFAPENEGKFGSYIDVKENEKRVIDENTVAKNIGAFSKEYRKIYSDTFGYIMTSNEIENFNLAASFEKADRMIFSNPETQRSLLTELRNKKKEFERSSDQNEKMEIDADIMEIERKLMGLKDYTLFFIGGRLDYDALKEYFLKQNNSEQKNSKLEKVIKEFSKVSHRKFLKIDQKLDVHDDERREVFDEIYPGEDFETYNNLYKDYIEKLSDKKAIENVYRPFLKGRKLDDMTEIKKVRYMTSLGYLYVSDSPENKAFAEQMIRQSFPNIKINPDGTVNREEFEAIYKTFQREDAGLESARYLFEKTVVYSLAKQEEVDFSKIGINVDLEKITKYLSGVNRNQKEKSKIEFFKQYDEEEMGIIGKIKDLDLENPANVDAVAMILARLEKEQKRNDLEYETLKSFILSSQNRTYFSKYIDRQRLKTEAIPGIADPDLVNIDVIKAFSLEDKIEIGKMTTTQPIDEEYQEYADTKDVLELVYTYAGNPELLEEKIKTLLLWEHKSMDLFKKGDVLDTKKLEKISTRISEYTKNVRPKMELAKVLAKNLVTKEAMADYSDNFDGFVEESYNTIKDISIRGKKITKEEREKINNLRKAELANEADITEEEYYNRRPVGTEEDLERLEEREAARKRREEQSKEPEIEASEVEEEKPISDREFSRYMAVQKENVADITVSEETRKPKIDLEEKVDFQIEDSVPNNNVRLEHIETGLTIAKKKNPILDFLGDIAKKLGKVLELKGNSNQPARIVAEERPKELTFEERYCGYNSSIAQANYNAKSSSEKAKKETEITPENNEPELS